MNRVDPHICYYLLSHMICVICTCTCARCGRGTEIIICVQNNVQVRKREKPGTVADDEVVCKYLKLISKRGEPAANKVL